VRSFNRAEGVLPLVFFVITSLQVPTGAPASRSRTRRSWFLALHSVLADPPKVEAILESDGESPKMVGVSLRSTSWYPQNIRCTSV